MGVERKKTKYNNIYEVINTDGTKSFFANFSYKGRRYGDRNLTKLFGSKTAKQASEKLSEIKVAISQGNNPFEINSKKIDDLIKSYFKNKKENYVQSNQGLYNNHIKSTIGHLFINKVTAEHIQKIINEMQKKQLASATITKVRVVLNPIFEEAYLREYTARNILKLVKFPKVESGKLELAHRLNEPMENAVVKLYKSAMKVKNDKYKAMFLISIMCSRRAGEILKLKKSDFDMKNDTIRARKENTKTNIYEFYPLPIEVKEIVQNLKENLFPKYPSTFHKHYKTLIEDSGVICHDGCKITSHDNRNFAISLGSRIFRRELVDKVLSHKNKTISDVYTSHEKHELDEVYESYWKLLRSEK